MKQLLKQFGSDTRGNVLMITGLIFLTLIIAAGMGIDFGRQQLLRVRMQQSSDAAALAAGTAPIGADKKQVAKRYFNLNFTPSYLGVDRPDATVHVGSDVTVDTAGTIGTTFVANNGVQQMNAHGHSVVGADMVNNAQSYDVILVMDNSHSMDTPDAGPGGSLEADAGAPCRPRQYFDGPPSCPSEGMGSSRINALRFSAAELSKSLLNPNQNHSRVGAITWSTADSEIQSVPLTEDYNTVRSFLGQMIGFESTNSVSGMNAATQMADNFRPNSVRAVVLLTDGFNTFASTPISRNQPCPDGSGNSCSFDSDGCSDGEWNTVPYCATAAIRTLPLCQNFKDHGVLVYTIAFGGEVVAGKPNAQQIQDFLSACASGTAGANQNQYFFVAPDADTLNAAFKSIVTSIGKIRIKE